MANPIVNDVDWDTIEVQGFKWEGLAKVSGFGRESEFDTKQAPGTQGATSTYRGDKLAEGKITLYLWTEDHWDQLPSFLLLLRFDPKKKSGNALSIWHPSFDYFNPPLRSVVVKKLGQPERVKDGDSLYTVTIDCLEYRPPKKANVTATPKGAGKGGGAGGGAANPSADDKYDKQIGDLLTQAQKALS